jgi:hypothetical protein
VEDENLAEEEPEAEVGEEEEEEEAEEEKGDEEEEEKEDTTSSKPKDHITKVIKRDLFRYKPDQSLEDVADKVNLPIFFSEVSFLFFFLIFLVGAPISTHHLHSFSCLLEHGGSARK